jgi:hypothetical protein
MRPSLHGPKAARLAAPRAVPSGTPSACAAAGAGALRVTDDQVVLLAPAPQGPALHFASSPQLTLLPAAGAQPGRRLASYVQARACWACPVRPSCARLLEVLCPSDDKPLRQASSAQRWCCSGRSSRIHE